MIWNFFLYYTYYLHNMIFFLPQKSCYVKINITFRLVFVRLFNFKVHFDMWGLRWSCMMAAEYTLYKKTRNMLFRIKAFDECTKIDKTNYIIECLLHKMNVKNTYFMILWTAFAILDLIKKCIRALYYCG